MQPARCQARAGTRTDVTARGGPEAPCSQPCQGISQAAHPSWVHALGYGAPGELEDIMRGSGLVWTIVGVLAAIALIIWIVSAI
jgi:hypothetical protein